ncbi:hypothetical protein L596_023032 [Steinernema carpocapsae]|uniref:ShKT domain-containing protein n=1 Tax=Steinernema carpocapsae TaxID=34508 RepID=A0A4U5MCH1_STECR|nr:hypothetical protein L596_023032 [Steinernema carpocapsae]
MILRSDLTHKTSHVRGCFGLMLNKKGNKADDRESLSGTMRRLDVLLLALFALLSAAQGREAKPCFDVSTTCATWSFKCEDPEWKKDMTENCARTCGYCPLPVPCEDSLQHCPQLETFCHISPIQENLKKRCPKTCGHCRRPVPKKRAEASCKDEFKNCHTIVDFCQDPVHKEAMKSRCLKTCGYCTPANDEDLGNKRCKDRFDQCRVLGCSDPIYMKNCPKTCGLCSKYHMMKF